MTKYQYNVNKNTIECDGDFVAYVNSVDGFRIADKLTVLAKENEQLKKSLSQFAKVNREGVKKVQSLAKENEQLKQSIKEIDDAELHLKQIILKRIDDYIWEWEDEGTPVAQVLKELKDEIKGDVE